MTVCFTLPFDVQAYFHIVCIYKRFISDIAHYQLINVTNSLHLWRESFILVSDKKCFSVDCIRNFHDTAESPHSSLHDRTVSKYLIQNFVLRPNIQKIRLLQPNRPWAFGTYFLQNRYFSLNETFMYIFLLLSLLL